jgi:tetratricopeptide (TPR) repeat protein
MATTYNGIGTHYLGKRNLNLRPGVCAHCGRSAELASYDTRLWFVILLIPVIPLGRKRVVDLCPFCTRHHVIDADQWEKAKQVEIADALKKFQSNPAPEQAIGTHRQLLRFHQVAQAAEFGRMITGKYSDNATVQAYLGDAATYLGELDAATPFYTRALELSPQLPVARCGVARAHIRARRLDEARRLLDFLERPGAVESNSLEPLEELAYAYQHAGRHAEALELFAKLQQALPAVAQVRSFRSRVKHSERALQHGKSILPRWEFRWRRVLGLETTGGSATLGPRFTKRGVAIAGLLLTVALGALAVGNEYIRRHRTLFLVNGLKQPVTVQVPGIGTVPALRGVKELILPEGRYRAVINGPVHQEIAFEVHAPYFARWLANPAWVLNVGGGAVLVLEQAVYSKNPRPATVSFYFGEPFLCFPAVTHPFQPLPESVQAKWFEEPVLTHLEMFRGDPAALFYELQGQQQPDTARRLAEWRLRAEPDDEAMLLSYANSPPLSAQPNHVEEFLRAALTNRPVRVAWHRTYQEVCRNRHGTRQLMTEYDVLVKNEPANSALLYLRGRICEDHQEGRHWFERACQADPLNPYPVYALAYDRMAVGDWPGARGLAAHAVELRPNDDGFVRMLRLCRVALGEFDGLEAELRAQLARVPTDLDSVASLNEVLISRGRRADADEAVSHFERALAVRNRAVARAAGKLLRDQFLYAVGDFAVLEKSLAGDRSPDASRTLFTALVEQGRLADAVKHCRLDSPAEVDPLQLLSLAVAWRLAGNVAEADRCQAGALASLEGGDADWKRAAALLRRPTDPTRAELDAIILPVQSKAILLAALAQQHPAMRQELSAAARQLNVARVYPYHLILRATTNAP